MGVFHKSPGQIIRSVFDGVNKAIRVISYRDDAQKNIDAKNEALLQDIVKQLKIINLYLEEISEFEIDK